MDTEITAPRGAPSEVVEAVIGGLTHDGRGVARTDGKALFVHGALPGEIVTARLYRRHRRYDEAEIREVITPSPDRVAARCAHVARCGGCALQHLDPVRQIEFKQHQVLDDLQRIGNVAPGEIASPLTGPLWGYRDKARLSVRLVEKMGRVLVGFREHAGRWVADVSHCHILHPAIGGRIAALAELIAGLECAARIPQIEVACDETRRILIIRHLAPLGAADRERLARFGTEHRIEFWLQAAGPESVQPLDGEARLLGYTVGEPPVELHFSPAQFTQVNPVVNRKMVTRALDWLEPAAGDAVLDLFCGIGNFALPFAARGARVTGIEGAADAVAQAGENARHNKLGERARFHTFDLRLDPGREPWFGPAAKVILDPPRSGAAEVMSWLAATGAGAVLYVSCQSASLARDAGELVHRHGYRLERVGVADLFPHTAHIETMALFRRVRG